MVKFLEQRQLAARGLTCGKTRRRAERGKLLDVLESGLATRLMILFAIAGTLFLIMMTEAGPKNFVPVQISSQQTMQLSGSTSEPDAHLVQVSPPKEEKSEQSQSLATAQTSSQQTMQLNGSTSEPDAHLVQTPPPSERSQNLERYLIVLLILVMALFQLWMNGSEVLRSNSRLALVFSILLFQFAIIKLLLLKTNLGVLDSRMMPLLIPYAFAPLTISVLLGKNEALFVILIGSLWGAFLLDPIDPIFLIISLMTGFVVLVATGRVRRRSRIIRAGIYGGMTTWILALFFGPIGPITWSMLKSIDWSLIALQSATALGVGLGTAIIVSGLLPILEFLFRVTTDISWLEMADLNHPLLRRLSLEAPGTYQHSMAMANLAESAAEAIGANPTTCRVGAYFHDIGKLIKPEYFTENISFHKNPHDELTPTMSALIISAHIKEGVDLALKNKLHRQIIDIIRQHHGTTMVGCFFHKARQHQEDARLGGKIMNIRPEDIPEVYPDTFRYPGPKPQTKEAVIIGLVDAAESASRSMERPTPQRIDDLVHTLLKERLNDGQYDECPITMKELHKITDTLVSNLIGMLHRRISYNKPSDPLLLRR
ncbi:MAG: hypothetical protein A3F67_05260 [Verrucomicrobia bacterium RIFCSPHIGHO2_12_FULL_41_10]|nr:MAG: hypothetical protein A3F67_05260 [Verrucomicrobia bacterium RIFCSPHIGHO2_12_FULL_41_10]HLB34463.1 HDIG domain-containing protein [Chthoniobacterales bacterium]